MSTGPVSVADSQVPGIKKLVFASGATRYEYMVTIYVNGERRRARRRKVNLEDAKKCYARERATATAGEFIATKNDIRTVEMACAEFLLSKKGAVVSKTLEGYRSRLRAVRAEFGGMPVHRLSKMHILALIDKAVAEGYPREDGQKPKRWRPRTVNFTLVVLTMVLDQELAEKRITTNVAKLMQRHISDTKVGRTLTVEQLDDQLYPGCIDDRYYVAYRLGLSGLRLEEVCGLRWESVDLDAGTIDVTEGRQMVQIELIDGTKKVVEEVGPLKSESSFRTLKVSEPMLRELKRMRTRQLKDRMAAGPYWIEDGDYVVTMETGKRVAPGVLTDHWVRMLARLDLPRITFHEARHTCGTLLAHDGLPAVVIAAWLGHANSIITQKTYIHKQAQSLLGVGKSFSLSITG